MGVLAISVRIRFSKCPNSLCLNQGKYISVLWPQLLIKDLCTGPASLASSSSSNPSKTLNGVDDIMEKVFYDILLIKNILKVEEVPVIIKLSHLLFLGTVVSLWITWSVSLSVGHTFFEKPFIQQFFHFTALLDLKIRIFCLKKQVILVSI